MNKGENMGELHYKNLSLDDIVYLDDNGVQCTEVWRDIPDYEGYYQVSDLGRVKSLSREVLKGNNFYKIKGRILIQSISSKYLIVGLSNKSIKSIRIHQLIGIVFLNHIPNGSKIVLDHKNNNKLDNRLNNIQIVSTRFNTSKDKKNKTSIYTGVSFCLKNNNYKSGIRVNGKHIHLGCFITEEEASEYYQKAVKSIDNNEEISVKFVEYISKYKGVSFDKTNGKWFSQIYLKGHKKIFVGYFDNEYESYIAYKDVEKAFINNQKNFNVYRAVCIKGFCKKEIKYDFVIEKFDKYIK